MVFWGRGFGLEERPIGSIGPPLPADFRDGSTRGNVSQERRIALKSVEIRPSLTLVYNGASSVSVPELGITLIGSMAEAKAV